MCMKAGGSTGATQVWEGIAGLRGLTGRGIGVAVNYKIIWRPTALPPTAAVVRLPEGPPRQTFVIPGTPPPM